MSNDELTQLLKTAKTIEMTPEEQEQQRRSFAYGNTKIENSNMTVEAIEKAASALADDDSH